MIEPHETARIAQRHRAYLAACEPFLRIKADVIACSLPVITLYPDGRMEHFYRFGPTQQTLLDEIEHQLDRITAEYANG